MRHIRRRKRNHFRCVLWLWVVFASNVCAENRLLSFPFNRIFSLGHNRFVVHIQQCRFVFLAVSIQTGISVWTANGRQYFVAHALDIHIIAPAPERTTEKGSFFFSWTNSWQRVESYEWAENGTIDNDGDNDVDDRLDKSHTHGTIYLYHFNLCSQRQHWRTATETMPRALKLWRARTQAGLRFSVRSKF